MLSDEQIQKIAHEAIAEGKTYTDYAWHYVGEDTAYEIICDAIRKALQQNVQRTARTSAANANR